MRNRAFHLLILSIFCIFLYSCSSDKKSDDNLGVTTPDEELPDIITLSRTASINELRLSTDSIVFERLTIGSDAIYAISFMNDNSKYPSLFSLRQIPDNIILDERSTCKVSNNILFPLDSCVAIFKFKPTAMQPISGTIKYTDGVNYRDISYNINSIVDEYVVKSDISSALIVSKNLGEKGDIANFTISNQSNQRMTINIPEITDGFILYQLSECKEGINTLQAGGSCVLSIMASTQLLDKPFNTIINIKTYTDDSQTEATALNSINLTLSNFNKEAFNETIDSLSVSTTSLDFGSVFNDIKTVRSFTIENRSPFNKIRYQIASPTDNFRYDESSTCGISGGVLERGSSCDYRLYLTPQQLGDITDSIKVYVKSRDKSVTLKAVNDVKPVITLSDKGIDFVLIDNQSVVTKYIYIQNTSVSDITLKFENLLSLTIDSSSECINDTLLQPNTKCKLVLKADKVAGMPANITVGANSVKYDIPILSALTPRSANSALQMGDYNIVSASDSNYYGKIFFLKTATNRKVLSLFDPMLGTFEDLLPSFQSVPDIDNATIVSVNDTIYIFGGDNETGVLQDKLYSYSLTSKQFKTVVRQQGNQPVKRSKHTMLKSDKKLFIYGGVTDNGEVLDDLHILDLSDENKLWKPLINNSLRADKEIMRAGFIDNQTIYLLSDRSVYSYNLSSNASTLTKVRDILPTVDISSATLTVSGELVYALGVKVGGVVQNGIYAIDIINNDRFELVDSLQSYDVTLYNIIKMVSVDKRIYIFATSSGRVTVDLFYFDILTSNFREQNSRIGLKELSSNSVSANVTDKIFYFDNGKVLYFDTNSNRFNEVTVAGATLPNDIYATTVVDSKVYLLGKASDEFYIFDTKPYNFEKETNSGSDLSGRSGATLNYHNGKIYLYGGYDGTTALSDFYYYDTVSAEWTSISTTGVGGLYNYSSGVLGDKIYIVGGSNGTDNSSKLYEFNTETPAFREVLDDPSLKNGFCKIFFIDGEMYISVNEMIKKYDNTSILKDIIVSEDGVLQKISYLSIVYNRLIYNFDTSSSKFDRILLKN